MNSVTRKIERRGGEGFIRYKNIMYRVHNSESLKSSFRIEVPLKNGIPEPSLFTPVAKANYYRQEPLKNPSFTHDYRLRPNGYQSNTRPMATKPHSKWKAVLKALGFAVGIPAALIAFGVISWSGYFLTEPNINLAAYDKAWGLNDPATFTNANNSHAATDGISTASSTPSVYLRANSIAPFYSSLVTGNRHGFSHQFPQSAGDSFYSKAPLIAEPLHIIEFDDSFHER